MLIITLFTNVLKKFFTGPSKNENKEATEVRQESTMIHQIKSAAARSSDTLLGDAIGAAALMVMLVGALYLPGLA